MIKSFERILLEIAWCHLDNDKNTTHRHTRLRAHRLSSSVEFRTGRNVCAMYDVITTYNQSPSFERNFIVCFIANQTRMQLR
jgi:hypothetical protein